jgi:hypothetical protein
VGLKTRRGRAGQALTEYIIVVGLVGSLLVGAVGAFRAVVGTTYEHASDQIEQVAEDIGRNTQLPSTGPRRSGPTPIEVDLEGLPADQDGAAPEGRTR